MVEQVLFGVMLPAVIAAAVLLFGWRVWRRREPCRNGHWSVAVAFTLAFAVSFMSKNWPSLLGADEPDASDPYAEYTEAASSDASTFTQMVRGSLDAIVPASKSDWIIFLAMAAGGIGLVASLVTKPKWLPWLAGLLLVGAVAGLIKPLDNPTHDLFGLWGLCGMVLLLWLGLEPLAARRPGASLPLAYMLYFTGLSLVVFATGGLSIPLVCGAMSGVCGAALVAAWLNPSLSFRRGATPMLAAIPAAILWLQAWYDYSGAPKAVFLLPLLSVPGLWLGELRFIARRRAWVGVIVRAALAAIPVAVAVILAMNGGNEDSSTDYG